MNPRYLICLMIMIMCITPAYAQTETVTAPAGEVIWAVDMEVSPGTTGTFTATLDTGTVIDGSFSYLDTPIFSIPYSASVDLDGDTSSTTFYIPGNLKMSLWHGDTSNDTRQIKLGYGQFAGAWNDVVVSDVPRSAMRSFTVTADQDVITEYEYLEAEAAAGQLAAKDSGTVDYILSLVWMFIGFVIELVKWIKFFFIDNLLLTLSLYIAVTGAMAFGKTKDIWKALKLFFGYQRKLVEFMIILWHALIQVAANIRGLFKFV